MLYKCLPVVVYWLIAAGHLLAQNGEIKPVSASAKSAWADLSGNFSVGTGFYTVGGGIPQRRRPFSYLLNGAPILSIYGIKLPFSFSVSDQGRSYTQPLQQIGVSPKWKWATLHAGFRTISFSKYGLNNQQMLGGGLELNPGKLHAGFMYGRLRSNMFVPTDSLVAPRHPLDDFSRRAFSAKLGYGSPNRYLDLSFLTAQDIASVAQGSLPTTNTVWSLAGNYRLSKKWSLKADLATSAYNTGLPEEPANKEASGISSRQLSGALRWAGETSLHAKFKKFDLKAGFKQIAPSFRSMGCPYLQNDYRQYSLGGGFRAFKNKLIFNGTLGMQTNNLDKILPNATRRLITTANISLNPGPKTGLSVSYNNFGLTQSARLPGQRADSLLIAQINNSLIGSIRYSIGKDPKRQHQLNLNLGFNQLGNFNAAIATQTYMTNLNATFSYSWPLSQSFNPNLSLIWLRNQMVNGKLNNAGLSASLSKDWQKGKWTNIFNCAFYRSRDGINPAGTTLQSDLNMVYKAHKRLSISVQFTYLKNRSVNTQAGGSFSEFLGRLSMNTNF